MSNKSLSQQLEELCEGIAYLHELPNQYCRNLQKDIDKILASSTLDKVDRLQALKQPSASVKLPASQPADANGLLGMVAALCQRIQVINNSLNVWCRRRIDAAIEQAEEEDGCEIMMRTLYTKKPDCYKDYSTFKSKDCARSPEFEKGFGLCKKFAKERLINISDPGDGDKEDELSHLQMRQISTLFGLDYPNIVTDSTTRGKVLTDIQGKLL